MPVNSKRKGKVGELQACKFLHSLGYTDARRTAQYRGNDISGDVECPKSLPGVHFEIKYGYDRGIMDVGTAGLRRACDQAWKDAKGKPWCVLWRPKRVTIWRMTCKLWMDSAPWTTADKKDIRKWLQGAQELMQEVETEKENP